MTEKIKTRVQARQAKRELFLAYTPHFKNFGTDLEMNYGEFALKWHNQLICRELVNFAEINAHYGETFLTGENVSEFLIQNRAGFKALNLFKKLCNQTGQLFHDYRKNHPYVTRQLTSFGLLAKNEPATEQAIRRAIRENGARLVQAKKKQIPYMSKVLKRFDPNVNVTVTPEGKYGLQKGTEIIASEQIILEDSETLANKELASLPRLVPGQKGGAVFKKFCELTTTFMIMYEYALLNEIIKNY